LASLGFFGWLSHRKPLPALPLQRFGSANTASIYLR
jgi:hypothetical protein